MSADLEFESDMLAAEYVLGTLDAVERDAAERRRATDPAFARMVAGWEQQLVPLADRASDTAPSAETWRKVASHLAAHAAPAAGGNVVLLRRSVSRWRTATLLTGALAAGLAIFVVNRDLFLSPAPAPGGAYLAALNRGGDMPALIVRVDLATKAVTVRPIAAETPPGKSLELWYVASGQTPKSMGVLKQDREQMLMPSGMEMKGAVFAVSLEPMGGSPTGVATGPIVYKGALIPE